MAVNCYYQPIPAYSGAVAGGTLTIGALFGVSTYCWLISPTATPTSIYSESDLNSTFGNTYTGDFTCTAASFTNAAWVAAGWTSGTFNTFLDYELVNWVNANIPSKNRTVNITLYYGTIGGTDYRIPIVYMGNGASGNYPTVGVQLGDLFRKKNIDMSNAGKTAQGMGSFSSDNTRYACGGYSAGYPNGIVYINTISADLTFAYETSISEPTPGANFFFGGFNAYTPGVGLDQTGTRLVVGACGNTTGGAGRGQAYIYLRTGTSWALEATLSGAIADNDAFGKSVGITDAGDRVVIAAPGDDSARTNGGALYVYSRSGTSWSLEQKITAAAGTSLGINTTREGKLCISGDGTMIAAPYVGGTPLTTTFSRSGTTWTEGGTPLNNQMIWGISTDGQRIAVNVTNTSNVSILKWGGTTWSSERTWTTNGSSGPCIMSPNACNWLGERGSGGTAYKMFGFYNGSWRSAPICYAATNFMYLACNNVHIAAVNNYSTAYTTVLVFPTQELWTF